MTPVTCRRCQRPLHSAASQSRRIGRSCAIMESALRIATAPYSARQIADANAMIAAGKLKPLSREGKWQATSSDDKRVYVLNALGCPCKSPGPCYHRCGVAMVEIYQAVA